MRHIKNKIQVPKKNKQPHAIIRSPAFRKKFEDGMPRINHKYIPLHNIYDVEINDVKFVEEKGLKFWGCVMPPAKKFKVRKVETSIQPRMLETRGETMFKKYMKRRPSLTLTPRSFDTPQKSERKHEQKRNSQFLNTDRTHGWTRKQNPQKMYDTIDSFMLTNEGEIAKLNSKSLYTMSPQQLKASITWKKRFLELFKHKITNIQQNFQWGKI